MGDDGDAPVVHRAKLDDEFLKHPGSGALIRNPFLEKGRKLPILFSRGEYEHNNLDEALNEWQTVTISEAGFRDMVNTWSQGHGGSAILPSSQEIASARSTGSSWRSPAAWCNTRQRAAVGKLKELANGVEFSVHLRKSSFNPPKHERRRPGGPKEAHKSAIVDKVAIEVSDDRGVSLRIDAVNDGLMSHWNKAHPSFVVRPGDQIIRVNDHQHHAGSMLDELIGAHDVLRLTVRRVEPRRRSSTKSGHGEHGEMESRQQSKAEGAEGFVLKPLTTPKANHFRRQTSNHE